MNRTRFLSLLLFVVAGMAFSFQSAWGDSENSPTLTDVHKILLQAAGYQTDTPPTIAEKKELLEKALRMLEKLPPVYHGHLAVAKRSVVAALDELANGDTANRAKGKIYDADDQIKGMMDR